MYPSGNSTEIESIRGDREIDIDRVTATARNVVGRTSSHESRD